MFGTLIAAAVAIALLVWNLYRRSRRRLQK